MRTTRWSLAFRMPCSCWHASQSAIIVCHHHKSFDSDRPRHLLKQHTTTPTNKFFSFASADPFFGRERAVFSRRCLHCASPLHAKLPNLFSHIPTRGEQKIIFCTKYRNPKHRNTCSHILLFFGPHHLTQANLISHHHGLDVDMCFAPEQPRCSVAFGEQRWRRTSMLQSISRYGEESVAITIQEMHGRGRRVCEWFYT